MKNGEAAPEIYKRAVHLYSFAALSNQPTARLA